MRELTDAPAPSVGITGQPEADVLCIGGRNELDYAAATMIAALLSSNGISARASQPISIARGTIGQLDLKGVRAVSLNYLDPSPQAYARYVCRRLDKLDEGLAKVICCWNLDAQITSRELETRVGCQAVVAQTVPATLSLIQAALARPRGELPDNAAATRATTRARARETGLTVGAGAAFERLAEHVKREFGTSLVMVTVLDDVAHSGLVDDPAELSSLTLPQVLGSEVSCRGETIVVEDVADDDRFSNNTQLIEKGIRFFAAAPVRSEAGAVIAALSILDVEPRSFSEGDRAKLSALADDVANSIEHSKVSES